MSILNLLRDQLFGSNYSSLAIFFNYVLWAFLPVITTGQCKVVRKALGKDRGEASANHRTRRELNALALYVGTLTTSLSAPMILIYIFQNAEKIFLYYLFADNTEPANKVNQRNKLSATVWPRRDQNRRSADKKKHQNWISCHPPAAGANHSDAFIILDKLHNNLIVFWVM